ncbi:ribonuclease III domain-containing protein [Zopfochytrium polystomum]|nr:ribonuclease III domain-containing protein [Zopfochytrium polystomum]
MLLPRLLLRRRLSAASSSLSHPQRRLTDLSRSLLQAAASTAAAPATNDALLPASRLSSPPPPPPPRIASTPPSRPSPLPPALFWRLSQPSRLTPSPLLCLSVPFSTSPASAAAAAAHTAADPATTRARARQPAKAATAEKSAAAAWAPPPSPQPALSPKEEAARLAAFAQNVGIDGMALPTLTKALTYGSHRDGAVNDSGDRFRVLGEKLLDYYIVDFLSAKHPSLAGDALTAAASAYTGVMSLASVGKALGVQSVMRWRRYELSATTGEVVVVSRVVQALIGAIFQEQGASAARAFLRAHLLSRPVDLSPYLKLATPKLVLTLVLEQLGRPAPVSRVLKDTSRPAAETATASAAASAPVNPAPTPAAAAQRAPPVFVVAVATETETLGVGYGPSLAAAEAKACKNAIETRFLKNVRAVEMPEDADAQEAALSFLPAAAAAPAELIVGRGRARGSAASGRE